MTRARGVRRRGVMLAENLMAMAILGTTVIAVSEAVVSSQKQAAEAAHALNAVAAAEDLLARAIALPYADPEGTESLGPDDGETLWALFDNIDDYHGHRESAGNLIDASGESITDAFVGFNRSIDIENQTQNIAEFDDPVVGLLVTVTVLDAKGRSWSIQRFVAAPFDP